MRILVAGEWRWPWYQEAFADALGSLGHEACPFGWAELFYDGLGGDREPHFKNIVSRLQNRLLLGPLVSRLNRRLVNAVDRLRPDIVLLYNAHHVLSRTLRKIKRVSPDMVIAQYLNDNPFSDNAAAFLWRHVKRSIPLCDVHFIYRHANAEPIRRHGGKNVYLLRSYFVPHQDFREEPGPGDERFSCDVVFAGHYEDDGRVEALEKVAASGVKLNLFGGGWQRALRKIAQESPLRRLFPVRPAFGREYRLAISGAKIALCFLSKLNRDTYTRRCFQVPAMGTFLLSEYTPDLAELFTEGEDIEFFRSPQEMLQKIERYQKNDTERELIADNGCRRVHGDGHDVVSRAKRLLAAVREVQDGHTA